jgi:hypothetical protein
MPLESDERIAFEELVGVELSNGSARFKKDQVKWLAKTFAHPTVRLQFLQRFDSFCI